MRCKKLGRSEDGDLSGETDEIVAGDDCGAAVVSQGDEVVVVGVPAVDRWRIGRVVGERRISAQEGRVLVNDIEVDVATELFRLDTKLSSSGRRGETISSKLPLRVLAWGPSGVGSSSRLIRSPVNRKMRRTWRGVAMVAGSGG